MRTVQVSPAPILAPTPPPHLAPTKLDTIGLNAFYSKEKDWVWHKARHYISSPELDNIQTIKDIKRRQFFIFFTDGFKNVSLFGFTTFPPYNALLVTNETIYIYDSPVRLYNLSPPYN